MSYSVRLILNYNISTHIIQCIMCIHTSRRPDTKWLDKYTFSNSHTRSLYKWPSHRLTDSLTHSSLLQSVTLILRDTQTHWQIDTATNTVLCSLIDQLGLVNDRLTTNRVSDCLFDSIPYNKLYNWILRLFFLLLTLPSSTLRGYIVTAPSSLVILPPNSNTIVHVYNMVLCGLLK